MTTSFVITSRCWGTYLLFEPDGEPGCLAPCKQSNRRVEATPANYHHHQLQLILSYVLLCCCCCCCFVVLPGSHPREWTQLRMCHLCEDTSPSCVGKQGPDNVPYGQQLQPLSEQLPLSGVAAGLYAARWVWVRCWEVERLSVGGSKCGKDPLCCVCDLHQYAY